VGGEWLAVSDLPRPDRVPRRRWRIAWLLGIGVLVNYFDRVNLSVSCNSLFAAFAISDVIFGYLSGAYNWTYAACRLPIGVTLDKFGVRRIGRRLRVPIREHRHPSSFGTVPWRVTVLVRARKFVFL